MKRSLITNRLLMELIFVPIGAALLTGYCLHQGYQIHMHIVANVFFSGIFFAFAITLGTATRRRYEAFDELAALKSHILSLGQIFKIHFNSQQANHILAELTDFFPELKKMLQHAHHLETEQLIPIDQFSKNLMQHIYLLKDDGMESPIISRMIHWHQEMLFSIEKLISIKEHNTPKMLRNFLNNCLMMSVFVLSPEFSTMGYYGIFSAFIVSIMIIALLAIQDAIEDPFISEVDEIHFRFIDRLKIRLGR